MSYTNRIAADVAHEYRALNDLDHHLEMFMMGFEQDHPHENISDVEMTFEKRIITSDTAFSGNYPMSLRFINCYFQGEVNFHKSSFAKKVSFEHCFCDDEFYFFPEVEFKDDFNIINLVVSRQIYVKGGKFAKCLWSVAEKGTITIAGGDFEELNIGYWGGTELRELTLDNRRSSGFIRVSGENSKIEYLLIFQSSKDLIISIEDISLNILSIYRYRNDAGFRLTNIKPFTIDHPSEISIAESYLGKAEFYSVDFKQFEIVSIVSTHLTDVSFVNIGWKFTIKAIKGSRVGKSAEEETLLPKLEALEKDWFAETVYGKPLREDSMVRQYYTHQRETFRQLKFALGKQGDVINEQKFHTLEMRAYDKSLPLTADFWTVLIIKFSFWFSDFGQSFIRPVRALLIGQFLLMLLFINAGGIKEVTLSLGDANIQGFQMALEKYFFLVNPLRKIDENLSWAIVVVDLIMRIWASYMLYNIVRATRRFIK